MDSGHSSGIDATTTIKPEWTMPTHLESNCEVNKLGDEYILKTTIVNTTKDTIELPEKVSNYVLGVQLKNSSHPEVLPSKDSCIGKRSNLIDNCKLVELKPGESIEYTKRLSQLFDITSKDIYSVWCEPRMLHSEKQVCYTSTSEKIPFFVQEEQVALKQIQDQIISLEITPRNSEFLRLGIRAIKSVFE